MSAMVELVRVLMRSSVTHCTLILNVEYYLVNWVGIIGNT